MLGCFADIDSTVEGVARLIDGAAFALDAPDVPPALWGKGSEILLSLGEPLLIVGPDGSGKTTLALWLALALVGITSQVLDLSVEPVDGPVVYVAADRPRATGRNLKRFVTESERDALAERLRVLPGPLEFDMAADPSQLARWAQAIGARVLILDSLGALVPRLAQDEVGSAVSVAIARTVAAGVDVVALFHPRKATSDNKKPNTLADVYGSRWLTAVAGSVISLWADPGDPVVEFRHLKQPIRALRHSNECPCAPPWLRPAPSPR